MKMIPGCPGFGFTTEFFFVSPHLAVFWFCAPSDSKSSKTKIRAELERPRDLTPHPLPSIQNATRFTSLP